MSRKRKLQRSFLSRLGELLFGSSHTPALKKRRSLRVESLENRQLMLPISAPLLAMSSAISITTARLNRMS